MAAETRAGAGARVIPVPPPAYYAVGLVAGLSLDRAVALPLGPRPVTVTAGVLLLAAGVALAAAGVAAVIRHRTTIVPHHPVTRLITAGPYRISRNPMYTGLAVAYTGLALVLGSGWPLVLLPLVLIAVRRLVIRPEEAYLAGRFGPAYAAYRERVRRWL